MSDGDRRARRRRGFCSRRTHGAGRRFRGPKNSPRMPFLGCPSGPCSLPSLKAPSTHLNHRLKVHEVPSKTMRDALMAAQEAHSKLCLRLQGSPGKVATSLRGRSQEGQLKVRRKVTGRSGGRSQEGQLKVRRKPHPKPPWHITRARRFMESVPMVGRGAHM